MDPEGFAAHFVDYYKISGWHLANGKPMRDWRKAVITWEPNNKFRQFGKPQQAASSAGAGQRRINPRDYDFSKDWEK